MARLKSYYRLTKPGIVYSNALMAMAGYLFAVAGHGSWGAWAAVLFGTTAVVASACVYNNVLDRDIDAQMSRTKQRALVSGEIGVVPALLFASLLLVTGLSLLYLGANPLATAVALFGHFAYVVVYGFAKRTTVHGTLVGTLAGSTPPVIGYAAATGRIDHAAVLLFMMMTAWQMPHFFAIAIFRHDDYANAGVPVLSVVRGLEATRRQIIVYAAIFLATCIVFGIYGGASLLWTLVVSLASAYWLYLCFQPVRESGITGWARGQFGWSLSILLILCLTLSLDSFWH